VEHAFAGIRRAPRSEKPAVVETQSAPAVRALAKEVEQLYVQLGVRAYDLHDERRYPLTLMASILGGGMSSRLFEEVREKRGLAYYVYAASSEYTDSGYLEVSAGLNHGKAAEGLKVILHELEKVAADGVTEEELGRVKDRAEGQMAFLLESTNGTANDYGSSLLFHGKVLTPEEELAKIRAVTRDDILTVARDIFRNDRLNLAVIGPKVADDEFKDFLRFNA
jgi:predicted Zn-dependent peptidase